MTGDATSNFSCRRSPTSKVTSKMSPCRRPASSMHPCELENSALASLAKRLTNAEKRSTCRKDRVAPNNDRKRNEKRTKRKRK